MARQPAEGETTMTFFRPAALKTVLMTACLLLSASTNGLCRPARPPKGAAAGIPRQGGARAAARLTYNETLGRLFEDLGRARTADEMRAARAAARRGFLKAASQDASYPLPLYNLGVLAEADEDWDAAIRYFEQFRRLDTGSEFSLKAQRKIEYLGRVRDADATPEGRRRRLYEQALSEANTLANLGLVKEAVAVAGRAARLDDTRWEAYALIGNALSGRMLFADAAGFFRKAAERAPRDTKPGLLSALKLCETRAKR